MPVPVPGVVCGAGDRRSGVEAGEPAWLPLAFSCRESSPAPPAAPCSFEPRRLLLCPPVAAVRALMAPWLPEEPPEAMKDGRDVKCMRSFAMLPRPEICGMPVLVRVNGRPVAGAALLVLPGGEPSKLRVLCSPVTALAASPLPCGPPGCCAPVTPGAPVWLPCVALSCEPAAPCSALNCRGGTEGVVAMVAGAE